MRRLPLALLLTPVAAVLLGIIIFPQQSQHVLDSVKTQLAPYVTKIKVISTPPPTASPSPQPTQRTIATPLALASPTFTPLPTTQTTPQPTVTPTPSSTPSATPNTLTTLETEISPSSSPPASSGTATLNSSTATNQAPAENVEETQDFDQGPAPRPPFWGPALPWWWPGNGIKPNLPNLPWFFIPNNRPAGGLNLPNQPQAQPPKPGNQAATQLISTNSDTCDIRIPNPDEAVIAVIPDTQKAVRHHPDIYLQQMDWLAKNRQRLTMVVFLGDAVDLDTTAEWETFDQGTKLLEARSIPYAIVAGNHDYPQGPDLIDGTERSAGSRGFLTKNYNKYFNVTQSNGVLQVKNAQGQVRNMPTLEGVFENSLDNSYHTFTTASGNRQFLLLMLEFGPRDRVLRWANQVITEHPDHEVILTTHTYLNPVDGKRHSYTKHGHFEDHDVYSYGLAKEQGYISTYNRPPNAEGAVNDGEQIWSKIKNNQRLFLILSGHLAGMADVVDTNDTGEKVCQVATDFQTETLGGNGWSRFLRLLPANRPKQQQVVSTLFSPVTGQCRKHVDSQTFTKNLCLTASNPAGSGFGGGLGVEPEAPNRTFKNWVTDKIVRPIRELGEPEDHP